MIEHTLETSALGTLQWLLPGRPAAASRNKKALAGRPAGPCCSHKPLSPWSRRWAPCLSQDLDICAGLSCRLRFPGCALANSAPFSRYALRAAVLLNHQLLLVCEHLPGLGLWFSFIFLAALVEDRICKQLDVWHDNFDPLAQDGEVLGAVAKVQYMPHHRRHSPKQAGLVGTSMFNLLASLWRDTLHNGRQSTHCHRSQRLLAHGGRRPGMTCPR